MAIPLILSQPTVVRQTGQMTCWAAAFSSWSGAVGFRNPPSEARMLELFRGVAGALNGVDGGATETGIRTINSFGFMNSQAFGGGRLTPLFLERQLQQGHIYLAYKSIDNNPLNRNIGHVVVVYGVEMNQVRVMNPAVGISTLSMTFLRSRSHVVVGVPNGIARANVPAGVNATFNSMRNAPTPGAPRTPRSGIIGYDF